MKKKPTRKIEVVEDAPVATKVKATKNKAKTQMPAPTETTPASVEQPAVSSTENATDAKPGPKKRKKKV